MPKNKVDKAEALRTVKAAWVSRGYRSDYLAAHEYDREDDPKGELAYQRGFAEAAKKDPPRLPNPSHYPNSTSAQALILRQNKEIFGSRPADASGPNPKYETPIPDFYRRPTMEDPRYRSASSTPPSLYNSVQTSPVQQNGHYQLPQGQSNMMNSNNGRNQPPLLMEPKMGAPMGPPSRFR